MESAESINRDIGTEGPESGREDSIRPAPGVRVRREGFGLLFYDTGSTNLTFVKSGDLLEIASDSEGLLLTTRDQDGAGNTKARRILERLIKKGLICDTPIRL
jgi:putative mycofactocin binding protein MftB